MLLIQDFAEYRAAGGREPSSVTIGNFDGCHRGHQALIEAAVRAAGEMSGPAVGVTFSPRPDAFFRGVSDETLLFTEEQKTRALAEAGLSVQVRKSFDAAFSQMGPEQFYESCLRTHLGAKVIVIGDNFRFGRGRSGDAGYLAQRAKSDLVKVQVGQAVLHDGERISSTRIRRCLESGHVEDAARMLGRPYLLEGTIRRGDQLGRQLGVPTANLEDVTQLIPAYGIYAGYVWLSRESNDTPTVLAKSPKAIPAVFSLGIRPTLTSKAPPLRIEAHLLEGAYGPDALYGLRAGFYLTHRLREERKMGSLEELKTQMALDIAEARRLV